MHVARWDCQSKRADLLSVPNKMSQILVSCMGHMATFGNALMTLTMRGCLSGLMVPKQILEGYEPNFKDGFEDCTHSYAIMKHGMMPYVLKKIGYVCKMKCGESNWILIHDSCYLLLFPDKFRPSPVVKKISVVDRLQRISYILSFELSLTLWGSYRQRKTCSGLEKVTLKN